MPERFGPSENYIGNARFEAKHTKLYTEKLLAELNRGEVERDEIIRQLRIILLCAVDTWEELGKWIEENPYEGDI